MKRLVKVRDAPTYNPAHVRCRHPTPGACPAGAPDLDAQPRAGWRAGGQRAPARPRRPHDGARDRRRARLPPATAAGGLAHHAGRLARAHRRTAHAARPAHERGRVQSLHAGHPVAGGAAPGHVDPGRCRACRHRRLADGKPALGLRGRPCARLRRRARPTARAGAAHGGRGHAAGAPGARPVHHRQPPARTLPGTHPTLVDPHEAFLPAGRHPVHGPALRTGPDGAAQRAARGRPRTGPAGGHRPAAWCTAWAALAHGAGEPGPDLREVRAGAVDAPRPAAAGRRRGTGQAPGCRATLSRRAGDGHGRAGLRPADRRHLHQLRSRARGERLDRPGALRPC